MKKILSAITLFIAISLIGGSIQAYAADTATFVTLNGSANFTMELKSNTLIFRNAPLVTELSSFYVRLEDMSTNGNGFVRIATCTEGKSNGAVVELSGLVDGIYSIETGLFSGDIFVNNKTAVSNVVHDLDSDGVVETYGTYDFNSTDAIILYGADNIRFYPFSVSVVVKDGKPSFQGKQSYANNLEYISQERTDASSLDYNRQLDKCSLRDSYLTYLDTQAKSIVAGITDDYAKVKTIYRWVAENIWYDKGGEGSFNYFKPDAPEPESPLELVAGDRTVCGGYAYLTVNLLRAAGFPAKVIHGSVNGVGHAWVEAYVNNRWIFMEPTFDSHNTYRDGKFLIWAPPSDVYFDMSMAVYSGEHKIDVDYMKQIDEEMLSKDRYLSFISTGHFVLKAVTDFTVGGLLTSTYGFEAENLYWDWECTKPVNLATDRLDSLNPVIYVKNPSKTYTITFDTRGGTPINAITVSGKENDNYGVVPPKPANPTKKGYTFVGWSETKPIRDLKYDEDFNDFGPTYNGGETALFYMIYFGEDPIYKSGTYYAVWQENPVIKYKVTFKENGGKAIKDLTVTTNTTISKHSYPTRKGYKFVNWYKDAKCTEVWNFKTDKVKANTTLYAKWKMI